MHTTLTHSFCTQTWTSSLCVTFVPYKIACFFCLAWPKSRATKALTNTFGRSVSCRNGRRVRFHRWSTLRCHVDAVVPRIAASRSCVWLHSVGPKKSNLCVVDSLCDCNRLQDMYVGCRVLARVITLCGWCLHVSLKESFALSRVMSVCMSKSGLSVLFQACGYNM